MAKPEWGTKRKCLACGAIFYDMRKAEFACPKCGIEYNTETIEAAKIEAALKNVSNVKTLEDDMDEEAIVASVVGDADFQDTDDSPVDLLEDASDLGDDNHDMAGVVDNIGPGNDEE
ncbi:MAG: TIGR02300 family protein [Alphaproteobacteria bacterium]|nr:TIGR02300 family protein [Alphaproteobacteria bacterium]